MRLTPDPPVEPRTGLGPRVHLERALPLEGTPGAEYVERRGVPCAVAHAAGVRFEPDWNGRPAVVAPMRAAGGELLALHGRHLHHRRGEDKMLTIGRPGGAFGVLDGWRGDPLVLVEGLFDALALAAVGRSAVATIGRDVPWLAEVARGREVWLALDRAASAEREAARIRAALFSARVLRVLPPGRCQDWNSALVRLGAARVAARLTETSRLDPASEALAR